MTTPKSLALLLSLISLSLVVSGPPAKALTEVDSTQSTTVSYPIVTTGDLILGQQATLSGTALSAIDTATDVDTTQAEFDAELTNGSTMTAHQKDADYADRSGFAGIENNTVLTYSLANTSNISEIDTYSSWGDGGRSQQNYTLAYSTNHGASYTDVNTVSSINGPYGAGPVEVQVTLTGVLGKVTDLRFTFGAQENGGVGYSEIAVYGSAIPEPQSYALLGLGLLGLGWAVRRPVARA